MITYTYKGIHAYMFQHLPSAGPFSFLPIARSNWRDLEKQHFTVSKQVLNHELLYLLLHFRFGEVNLPIKVISGPGRIPLNLSKEHPLF